MKNIFQKTAKFIFSRLIYLVIGIFLAVGVTYVYATWDQAKTGGSGQLSEANWNELVTMIENNIGGSTSTCGNGILEAGEGCDDGGTSWTSGVCAGDCSRTNYWALPKVGAYQILYTTHAPNYWCLMHGFNTAASVTSGVHSNTDCMDYLAPELNAFHWVLHNTELAHNTAEAIWCKD